LVVACFWAFLLLANAQSLATPLLVGGSVDSTSLPSFSAAKPSGGTVLVAQSSSTFTALSGVFSGTLTTQVLSGDTTNPFSGGLTFTYLLSNDSTSVNSLNRVTLDNFSSLYSVDANYQSSSTGVIPTSFERDSLGDVIGVNFLSSVGPGVIPPGGHSRLLVLQTNATNYQSSSASIIDGSSATASTFVPSPTSVPEPSAILIGLLGTVGLGWVMVRRRRRVG
jgi:hypothetical protein